jgi:hypothetical protein
MCKGAVDGRGRVLQLNVVGCSSAGGGWARCAATGGPCAAAPRRCGTRWTIPRSRAHQAHHPAITRLAALTTPTRQLAKHSMPLTAESANDAPVSLCLQASSFDSQVTSDRAFCIQVELRCREDLMEAPLPRGFGACSLQPVVRCDGLPADACSGQIRPLQGRCLCRWLLGHPASYVKRSDSLLLLTLRSDRRMCGPGFRDWEDPGAASEPEAVPMAVQALRHLRWLAPRLTAVRELALVDWVRPSNRTAKVQRHMLQCH